MPGLIGISEFVDEAIDDYNSPTTSTFVSKMAQCRQTISGLEDALEFDREGLTKLKKAVKAIYNSGNTHVDNEMCLVRALERLGSAALSKEEPDIGAAFLKFSVVTKELSALMKTLMQNISNIIMFPVDTLLKSELRGVKGELKRPFDKAAKDYDAKYMKIEKEKKSQAKEVGMSRNAVHPAEIADEMDKERKLFQLQMCEYLIKYNDIKTKKGIELLQHLVEFYHAQNNYFKDGLKTIAHFGTYIHDLSAKLQSIKQKQDEERRRLLELRTLLRSAPDFDRVENLSTEKGTGYSLHQLQGDKNHGITKSGHLLKKSEGKVRRVWQKRRCRVTADGFLDIYHADESKPPTRVNLLTCQIKPVADDKRSFDLISYNRPYHFQADDESDQKSWISVLINCKEKALTKTFQHTNPQISPSLVELQKTLIRYVENLPGNDQCCDCSSKNDVSWISLNFGVLVCIQCSGIHRDLGVHHSRIQSLTLDNITTANLLIARAMGNSTLNDVMEATIGNVKLDPDSSMEERYDFIRAKYVAKRYVMRTCSNDSDLRNDLEQSIINADLSQLLQVWAEGADLTGALPSSRIGETALHMAVLREIGSTLHIVDFLIQNMPSQGLNKATNVTNSADKPGKNTALHLCAMHDKQECMKLLLRSGADYELKNEHGKTALTIAKETGHDACRELIECAIRRQKGAFDHINMELDWNLPHEDGSTDGFSDDETVQVDEKKRSRPPSYCGGESPVAIRSRSSTCDSIQSGSSPNTAACQLPRQTNQLSTGSCSGSGGGGGSGAGTGYPQSGTSPKQQNLFPQQGGRLSPGSMSNIAAKTYGQAQSNLSNRKSLSSTKIEKRTAPTVPPYSTLPHAPKHSQSVDAKEMRNNMNKMPIDTYNTLPHVRNSDAKQSLDLHFSNKIYEPLPFEAEIETPDKYDQQKYSQQQQQKELTTFRHRRSLSGESIGLHLAGAKLVLPSSCEIPILKPVDKNVIRPKLPPPGPPPNSATTPTSNNGRDISHGEMDYGTEYSEKSYYSDSGDMDYSNNGFETSGMLNASSNSISIDLSPGNTVSREHNSAGENYGYMRKRRRCRALYDCNADNDDELEFKENEIIVVLNERTDDENWMYGEIEGTSRRGMFPVSFVSFI